MPADGMLQVGTQVNLANLRAGMEEAQSAVKAASANMAAAQAEFGRAAAQGNAQAAAALKVYQTELPSAQSTLNSFAATEERETVTLRSNISARMAASAELRVLEGNLMGSTRAAGAFLATLPGTRYSDAGGLSGDRSCRPGWGSRRRRHEGLRLLPKCRESEGRHEGSRQP